MDHHIGDVAEWNKIIGSNTSIWDAGRCSAFQCLVECRTLSLLREYIVGSGILDIISYRQAPSL